jgi:hypothetical protein
MTEYNKYRVYKISIHILFFHYVADSKIYTIKPGKNAVLPGLKYSLLTLFLGWWNFSIFHMLNVYNLSLTALHTNFSGGEDYTKVGYESGYDEKTKWIYNNLSREVSAKVNIEIIDIIIELLDNYRGEYLAEKITYLNQNLRKIHIIDLFNKDLEHIILSFESFKTRTI